MDSNLLGASGDIADTGPRRSRSNSCAVYAAEEMSNRPMTSHYPGARDRTSMDNRAEGK